MQVPFGGCQHCMLVQELRLVQPVVVAVFALNTTPVNCRWVKSAGLVELHKSSQRVPMTLDW